MCGIYCIVSPSGKIYVGSSTDIKKRFLRYKYKGCEKQHRLLQSLKKYGVDAHKFEILFLCDKEDLFKWEAIIGHAFGVLGRRGLNCKLPKTDEYPVFFREGYEGTRHTKETRMRMSEAKKGKRFSKEHIQNVITARKKLILNKDTGEYFLGIKTVAEAISMPVSTLGEMLNGTRPNKTPFIFVDKKGTAFLGAVPGLSNPLRGA